MGIPTGSFMFIPGIEQLQRSQYQDIRPLADADLEREPTLAWYMARYPEWRSLFDGSALEQTISTTSDATASKKPLRWPVQVNIVNSYCTLHAGFLWGRGRTGASADDVFTVRVDGKVPGMPGPEAVVTAQKYEEILQYFWRHQAHILRHNGVIQQWAGGCTIKVSWNPWSVSSVYGIVLETIQPETFIPIWDPLNFTELFGVKIKHSVSKDVAIAKYGISMEKLEGYRDGDLIPVEEYWDRFRYYVRLGEGDKQIPARNPSTGEPMDGENPWKNPIRGGGIIPFVYVPRIRTGYFLGDSLAYHLSGLNSELNKVMADYGDALNRGAHPSFGISDYSGPSKRERVIEIPRNGALNLGETRPNMTPPKVHNFPLPQVPPQTTEYVERLLALSESKASLTPAARGFAQGQKSSITMAMEMLPTTNLVDWSRSYWSNAISGGGGLNEIIGVILHNKSGLYPVVPVVDESMIRLPQHVDFRPVVPRDKTEIIDEVVRLATVNAIPPKEWLRRLGDLKDIDETFDDLIAWLTFVAEKEAAVAGREIKVSTTETPKTPREAYPSITGKTAEPSLLKQQSTQPEGQKGLP